MIPIYHGDHITKSPTFIFIFFFFAFSLLRTKRLIPVHQCTMHTESFAQFFFQKMKYTLKKVEKIVIFDGIWALWHFDWKTVDQTNKF